jgi:hypothetical protein
VNAGIARELLSAEDRIVIVIEVVRKVLGKDSEDRIAEQMMIVVSRNVVRRVVHCCVMSV